jgi:hypothetical protein
MRILVLGFGPLARNITDRIKRFPEYGLNNKVFIYHIFTRRNSLSYGKNLVIEIPDPHGDGYRTYNDGLQGLDEYATTISNYKPWLLEEAESGAFDVVIDCTNRTQSSYSLIGEILRVSPDGLKIVPASIVGEDATISRVRYLLDGGAPWSSVEFDKTLLSLADIVNSSAEMQMKKYHQINRKADIDSMGNPSAATAMDQYSLFSAIPAFDQGLINRFIVNGEKSNDYVRSENYDPVHDCLVIEHEMLTSFFGWHHTEQLAAKEFLDSELEIESARYIKYLSSDSTPVSDPDSEYVIEYVHSGKLSISSADGAVTIPLVGGTEHSSFSYRPKINPPRSRDIHAGLETIVFTYRKMKNVN